MPFYDYICDKCGHEMEVMHSVHSRGPAACPNCGGPMTKAIAAPAVHFKGSGWARKERTGKAVRPSDDKESKSGDSRDGEKSSTTPAPSPDSGTTSAD